MSKDTSVEMQKPISPKDLEKFGFVKCPANSIDLYEMTITEEPTEEQELGPMKILVTHLAGPIEFCLLLCEGQRLYLQPDNLEDVRKFINCINRYEPVW